MAPDTFYMVTDRIREMKHPPLGILCGLGEPLLHAQFLSLVRHARQHDMSLSMTTNASLLTRDLSRFLLDEGLSTISFSVSNMGADYEKTYGLKFEATHRNIMDFLELKKAYPKRTRTEVNIVKYDGNRGRIRKFKRYWKKAGINSPQIMSESNRAGACAHDYFFLANDRHLKESIKMLLDQGLSLLCPLPFISVFVGWDGNYYICCQDYEKTSALGTVHEYSIREMDRIKKKHLLANRIEACRNCMFHPVNRVREYMFRMERGTAKKRRLQRMFKEISKTQEILKHIFQPAAGPHTSDKPPGEEDFF